MEDLFSKQLQEWGKGQEVVCQSHLSAHSSHSNPVGVSVDKQEGYMASTSSRRRS
jgi:hypothetical protein